MSRGLKVIAAVLLLGVGGGVVWFAIQRRSPPSAFEPADVNQSGAPLSQAEIEALRPEVEAFCGACHVPPKPEAFPRAAWYDEVRQGYDFYYASLRRDLSPPKIAEVVSFYRSQAPLKMDAQGAAAGPSSPSVRFRAQRVPHPAGRKMPAVSYVHWDRTSKECYFCDMGSGEICRLNFRADPPAVEAVGSAQHPAHVTPVDLDDSGRTGLLVAELGSRDPADHDRGQVIWMKPLEAGGFQAVTLYQDLGRVADVQPVDVDGDGDLDLVVAEFGWRTTGRILLLRNVEQQQGVPQFQLEVVDDRHGSIHVPVTDLDGDGRLDFMALISQEFESIEAFFNRAGGRFEKRQLYAAPDPSYGSSGIQLVDLDLDGDLDVLYTNGDTLDSHYLKPFHSVQWLENTGETYRHHKICDLPGVYRAVAEDLDRDGDVDVAACALLPESVVHGTATGRDYDAVIWLEQTAPGKFARHRIQELQGWGALALDVGDFDSDGWPDLAVGSYSWTPLEEGGASWLTIWWNRGGR